MIWLKKASIAALLIVTLGSAAGQLGSLRVSAQDAVESEQTPAAEISADPIFEIKPQNTRVLSLQQLYIDQVEAYRIADRSYRTANEQDLQLKTLNSLEEAVQASQEVMKRRTDVLLTYTELLLVQLQDALGIELTLKRAVEDQLVEQIESLRSHREVLDQATDRDAIEAAGDDFADILPEVRRHADSARTLIQYGNLQTVYDKAQLIAQDIRTQQQANQTSALKQAERDRAYQETQRLLTSVSQRLRSQREEMAADLSRDRGSIELSAREALTIYSDLSKSLEYLEELLRI